MTEREQIVKDYLAKVAEATDEQLEQAYKMWQKEFNDTLFVMRISG